MRWSSRVARAGEARQAVTSPSIIRSTTDALGALWRVLTTSHLTIAEKRDAIQGFVSHVIPIGEEGVEVVLRPESSLDQKNKNTHLFWTVKQGLTVTVE